MDSETLATTRQPSSRDDCWTAEASATLVDAWGRRYLELNRGNLRQKDWEEVADAVNALHGHTKKTRRTDIQCKNRIDTLKKKYKVEKMKISDTDASSSSWPFFSRMDFLIGPSNKSQTKPPTARQFSPPMALPLPYDRGLLPPAIATPSHQRPPFSSPALNYSAMAAAAAAADDDDENSEEEEEEEEEEEDGDAAPVEEEEGAWVQGMRRVAEAIEKFGEVFEEVERKKQKMMVELEKQRMLFAQDLEVGRIQWFTDTLVQQHKKKRATNSSKPCASSDDGYQ